MATAFVGQRISYDGALCTVRYAGEVSGTSGVWLGVEWDDPGRGKHDGVHKGVRYFTCQARSPPGSAEGAGPLKPASFVRPARPADRTRTFLEAVNDKYAAEEPAVSTTTIISGKVAEEVGFEKVRRQMAQIETLRVVILDAMCVLSAMDSESDAGGPVTGLEAIRATCPSITELDLSRNLFTEFRTVADICGQLPDLRSLRVNGNRFRTGEKGPSGTFDNAKELAVDETLLSWEEIGHVAANFPTLLNLSASSNQLSSLPTLPPSAALPYTLTTLSLEFNEFTALSDLASLSSLKALKNLHLKGGAITKLVSASEIEPPVFPPSLHYVDISYNRVDSWAFVDGLPDVFPGLTNLRFAHNPIYDNPFLDADVSSTTARTNSTSNATASTEEAYMITVGRLAALRTLNFSAITPQDRSNAEMFYLSRIAKTMAAVPEGPPEQAVVARHRRFAELCELYGEPTVVRHTEINPAFLEARLITVILCLDTASTDTTGRASTTLQSRQEKSVQVPKSFDMYAVKSIAGKIFQIAPQKLRLVWETGEWDPVAGIDDAEADNDDVEAKEVAEEEAERAAEIAAEAPETRGDQANNGGTDGNGYYQRPDNHKGRWIKREVELKDSPRQFGFCVDGMEARIRVEVMT